MGSIITACSFSFKISCIWDFSLREWRRDWQCCAGWKRLQSDRGWHRANCISCWPPLCIFHPLLDEQSWKHWCCTDHLWSFLPDQSGNCPSKTTEWEFAILETSLWHLIPHSKVAEASVSRGLQLSIVSFKSWSQRALIRRFCKVLEALRMDTSLFGVIALLPYFTIYQVARKALAWLQILAQFFVPLMLSLAVCLDASIATLQAVVMALYIRSEAFPPAGLVLLCLSKRLHSIFMLRLFNDCIAVFVAYVAIWLLLDRRWRFSMLTFSMAVSVKMNVLLLAPPVLIIMMQASLPSHLTSAQCSDACWKSLMLKSLQRKRLKRKWNLMYAHGHLQSFARDTVPAHNLARVEQKLGSNQEKTSDKYQDKKILAYVQGTDLRTTVEGAILGIAWQLLLGAPFLLNCPASYISRAFDFSRSAKALTRPCLFCASSFAGHKVKFQFVSSFANQQASNSV